MSLQRIVLVLNASYEAINVVSARRAIKMICKGAALVEASSKHVIRTSSMAIPVPSVIRLLIYRRIPRQTRAVSRKSIMLRDRYTCQYCREVFVARQLTLDHVIPRSRSGGNTWENLVACCYRCNNLKADRTPAEAGMHLAHKPAQVGIHAKHRLMAGTADASWDRYLFC
jgi:5-methylcytosine-specific restriction endonuclease McrA